MIVLDEQLLGRRIETQIAQWYSGRVCFITDLRPGTIIKDDDIPRLLQKQDQPTLLTINEKDFWRKVAINDSFCVVCFALPDSKTVLIPALLRSLLLLPQFRTKNNRMGKVVRVSEYERLYYSFDERTIRILK
ncbi:MAG: hypothetical protein K1X65_11375 [Caldilineales bacterium]|nr:hypothetical protein [Caldilineales bacterium]MCW5859186.1 hypothetical protein [Caldilineales bacterium]